MGIRIVCNGCGKTGPLEDFNTSTGFAVCDCGNPSSFRIFVESEPDKDGYCIACGVPFEQGHECKKYPDEIPPEIEDRFKEAVDIVEGKRDEFDFDADYADAYWRTEEGHPCYHCPQNIKSDKVSKFGFPVWICGIYPKPCPYGGGDEK